MKKRIDLVDALRGFAIMGILLLHSIEHFNFYKYPDAQTQSALMQSLNTNTWDSLFFLFGSKAYGIFAMLFGFTFYLQYTKQEKQNIDFGPRFLWRMVILFGFGWINSILFPGEILLLYAVLAPFLFLIRKWSDTGVLIFAIIFLLQPFEIFYSIYTYLNPGFVVPNYQVGSYWQQTMNYLNEGSFISMIQNSYKGFAMTFAWSLGNGRVSQTIGLFALGLFLGRRQMFENTNKTIKPWATILTVSLIFLTILYNYQSSINAEGSSFLGALDTLIKAWKNLSQLLFTVSLFVILFNFSVFRKITQPLYAYGRMSLSNYMMQSLVGGILFYPYAFGLAFKVNVFYSLFIGIAAFIGFVSFCNWWIKKYNQGPMEKLWHRLTWINRSSLKISLSKY